MPSAKPTFSHPLGLSRYEYGAILDCHRARSLVSNGHYLPSFRCMKAHARMVERGFLTEVPEAEKGMSPPAPDWRMFKMTDENLAAYNAALDEVGTSKGDGADGAKPPVIASASPEAEGTR